MSIVFLTPPLTKPSEPGLSAAAAARVLREGGADAHWIDASMGWHDHVLREGALRANLALSPPRERVALDQAIRSVASDVPPLRRTAVYANRHVYTSAVRELEQALRLVSAPYPGVRLGVATIAFEARRVESRATLSWFATRPGPFDAYTLDGLLPQLDALGATHVAFSLTFQQQAPAAFRMARLLSQRRPGWQRWLGGPLVACWKSAGFELSGEPFSLFSRIVAGGDDDLAGLAHEVGPAVLRTANTGPLAAGLGSAPWARYLTPVPVVPAALGRGCYWRRCTFCPDHLHGPHLPCGPGAVGAWLREVAARFPGGAMVHFTDSAVPPSALEHVANVIRGDRLPIRWHGFVRVEEPFADPAFAAHLSEGGCAMLQLGVETGSPKLLARTAKGTQPDRIRRVLEATARAGILNHVYLLFGLPTETDEDREMTLALVTEAHQAIHAINPSLLNLPLGSPMHRSPQRFGITDVFAFGSDADLSLYEDFRCASSHPRSEARRWLGRRFFKHPVIRGMQGHLRTPFKANHLCFIESGLTSYARHAPRNKPSSPS